MGNTWSETSHDIDVRKTIDVRKKCGGCGMEAYTTFARTLASLTPWPHLCMQTKPSVEVCTRECYARGLLNGVTASVPHPHASTPCLCHVMFLRPGIPRF